MSAAELVADLLAAEVRELGRAGAVGTLVEVPQLRAPSAVAALAALTVDSIDLRIAYLLDGGEEAGDEAGLGDDLFDVSVERAEVWRNERGLKATIVVIAAGDEARLSSLREFVAITPGTLKRRLAARACERFGEINEVQAYWWDIVGADPLISLSELADYFLALDGRPQLDVVDQAVHELPRIGLLPDPDLLNNRNQIGRRVNSNREVRQRLQTLSDTDRKLIQKNIAGESDAGKRSDLQAGFRRVQQLRQGKAQPSLGEAQRLLGLRKAPSSNPTGKAKTKVPGAAEAAAAAVVEGAEDGLDVVLEDLAKQLDELDESSLKPVRLGLSAPQGDEDGKIQVQARSDLVNLMARLTGADAFGGQIGASGDGVEEMVRRFAGDADVRRIWTLAAAEEILAASENPGVVAVREALAAYAQARAQILSLTRSLTVAPLLVAGSPAARGHLLTAVAAYQDLLAAINDHHPALVDEFASDADGLIGEILKLDVILFEHEERAVALLTPVHPLYVWHFAEFCRIVEEQRERLGERDQ